MTAFSFDINCIYDPGLAGTGDTGQVNVRFRSCSLHLLQRNPTPLGSKFPPNLWKKKRPHWRCGSKDACQSLLEVAVDPSTKSLTFVIFCGFSGNPLDLPKSQSLQDPTQQQSSGGRQKNQSKLRGAARRARLGGQQRPWLACSSRLTLSFSRRCRSASASRSS